MKPCVYCVDFMWYTDGRRRRRRCRVISVDNYVTAENTGLTTGSMASPEVTVNWSWGPSPRLTAVDSGTALFHHVAPHHHRQRLNDSTARATTPAVYHITHRSVGARGVSDNGDSGGEAHPPSSTTAP